jgi:hypothetical protein
MTYRRGRRGKNCAAGKSHDQLALFRSDSAGKASIDPTHDILTIFGFYNPTLM